MRLSRRAILAAPAVLVLPLQAARAATPRMVVELFTSQGCSSCPPADALLGELAASSDVLALSMPVDYWDYLGWKDTLASPAHTRRQKAYSLGRGDRQVYTPQAVVNGLAHAIGSQRSAIEAAAASTRGRGGVLSLSVALSEEGDQIRAHVTAMTAQASGPGRAFLLKLRRKCEVAIGRGENTGRTVNYVNVVQGFETLGAWAGKEARFSLPKAKASGPHIDGYAVLVQSGPEGDPGAILGAAIAA